MCSQYEPLYQLLNVQQFVFDFDNTRENIIKDYNIRINIFRRMATLSTYTFNNMGNLGSDVTDQSQKTVYNTRFANYTLSNYFSEAASDSHVKFAVPQPTLNFTGLARGQGLSAMGVDVDTSLLIKTEQESALEKLQLF
jgi:hypothetical protein